MTLWRRSSKIIEGKAVRILPVQTHLVNQSWCLLFLHQHRPSSHLSVTLWIVCLVSLNDHRFASSNRPLSLRVNPALPRRPVPMAQPPTPFSIYSMLSEPQLQVLLISRRLPPTGTPNELALRLANDDVTVNTLRLMCLTIPEAPQSPTLPPPPPPSPLSPLPQAPQTPPR